MSDARHVNLLNRRSGDLAFLAVIAAAYLVALTNLRMFTPLDVAVLLALGAVFILVGTYGNDAVEKSGSVPLAVAYIALQLAVGTAIIVVGKASGAFTILLLPLAAQAVTLLPPRLLTVALVANVAAFSFALGLVAGWHLVPFSAVAYVAGVVFVVVFAQMAVREKRYHGDVEALNRQLEEANQKVRAYSAQVEELGAAVERNRTARELHDGLGRYLTAINIRLEAARATFESDPEKALDSLAKAQTLAKEGLGEVRGSAASVRTAPVEAQSLADAIEALAAESETAGLPTEVTVLGAVRPLPKQTEHVLYRAAQEGLNNARKHAQASHATVTLDYQFENGARLTVADDGVGAEQPEGGFGLLGLRERAQLLGGEVRVITAPGEGFTVEVDMPA